MRFVFLILFLFILPATVKIGNAVASVHQEFIWSEFEEIPASPGQEGQHGLTGSFSGITGRVLIIAGGVGHQGNHSSDKSRKIWDNDVFIHPLESGESDWQVYPDALPHEVAHGFSVSLPQGLLCIGGNNEKEIFRDVFLLSYTNGNISIEKWPSLPVPLTFMSGAFIDGRIYIAGGQTDASQPRSTHCFLALDIQNLTDGWQSLPAWPGPPRAFAVAAGQSDGFDNCFYLFSGMNYGPDVPETFLTDGYVYNPRQRSWEKLDSDEGPVFPVTAGTAVSSGANHIIFFGGVDMQLSGEGSSFYELSGSLPVPGKSIPDNNEDKITMEINDTPDEFPGFSRNVLFYHTVTNTLIAHSEAPFILPVSSNVLKHGNRFLFPGGDTDAGSTAPLILSAEAVSAKSRFGVLNTLVLVVYFGVLIAMGLFFSGRQKTSGDYFKAGGRLPWWTVGLSIFGTSLSAITFMAIPAKAYATDWSYLLFNAGIVLVAPLIIVLFIPFYRKINITTAYEYLEERFNSATRIITSLTFIIFQVGRMGIVLFLPSIALNVVTGIDIFLCIFLMGIFSLVYTMMGGIEAVVWTDALQVIVLMGGAILAVILISLDIEGGFFGIVNMAGADHKFNLPSTSIDLTNPTLITVLIATLFTNITTYGTDQTIVQRYLTTSTEKLAVKSVWTNAILTIPAALIFFFVGTALYVYFKQNPSFLNPVISDQDAIFPWYIFTRMPQGISGLLIAGIFAAAMSTLSSSMNSSATAYMVDIHYRFGWAKDTGGLKLPRIATLVAGLAGIAFAVMMATLDIKSLWDEFNKILGLVLGSLGGLFLLGILTRRANGTGALIGIAGSIMVQIWVSKAQPVHLLLYAATGFISCFITGYLASLIFPSDKKEIKHLTIYRKKY